MRLRRIVTAALLLCGAFAARAEVAEVTIARQPSLGHLPLMIMQDRKLLETNAAQRGIVSLKINYVTFAGGAVMNDALLSSGIQFAAGGVPPLVVLWAKTRGTAQAVKGVSAMNSMPLLMNTSRPAIRSLKDLTDADRIALPAVKISVQAILLQMAAEKEFGQGRHADLDRLTVTLSHPDGLRALLSGTEVTAHFTAAPIQELELARPTIHTLLNSYEVLGGPSTFNVVWSTARFHDENPKLYEAFLASLDQAIAIINSDKRAAAEAYVRLSGDGADAALILSVLNDPQVTFTTTPQGIRQYVDFMSRTGLIRGTASSWKELFFSNVEDKNGS